MISIIIPNYNGFHHLKDCYDSLRIQNKGADIRDFSIILIDNKSDDDSVKFTKENYPEVHVIENTENTGFAKAVNSGIKYSLKNLNPEIIILLNNDTECDKNFLIEMKKGFAENDTGSVACKMLNFTNRDVIDDTGDFIKKRGSPYARGHQEKDTGQYDKPEFIFGACAGASAYKSEVFKITGFFDEDFFAYYEDVDFSLRLQLTGFKCFYNPKAIVYHKRGATTNSQTGYQTMQCEKNLIALRLKNYPLPMLISNIPFFILARVRRYFLFIYRDSFSVFFSAVNGYSKGIIESPRSLRKRKEIQKKISVSNEYLDSIFR